MPWKETSVMDGRMELVLRVNGGESVACVARSLGVSRVTAHKWLARYACEGVVGLEDRSRARHCQPEKVPDEMCAEILRLRDRYRWGALKIRSWLMMHVASTQIPAASTIGEILKDAGCIIARKRRRVAQRNAPLSPCDAPNRVWCADFKGHFRTLNGVRCDPLTITDGYSRYLLTCANLNCMTYEAVLARFEETFSAFGLPERIRTDNGVPFASTRGLGLSRLSVRFIKYGITPERIRPGKPQENGRHERMHRTLKEETLRPPAPTPSLQQERFDHFQAYYNHERPHQALGDHTPAHLYSPSPRALPSRIPPIYYPDDCLTLTVYEKGSFRWRGHLLHLTGVLGGETIALMEGPTTRYQTIYFGHVPIAYLDTKYIRILVKLPKNASPKTDEPKQPQEPNSPTK